MKKLILILIAVILPSFAFAQDDLEKIKDLPDLLGANNVGTDFWFSTPPCFEDESHGHDNTIQVFITSEARTEVNLEIPAIGYYKAKESIPGNVIVFNLNPNIAQPVTKAGREELTPEKNFKKRGVNVYADDPIVVYVVVRYRATSDGFIAVPISSLGKEYVVQAYTEDPMFEAVWEYKLPSIANITAAFDDTEVSFIMGGNEVSQTAGGLFPGDTATEILDKGDVWMFMSKGQGADLTGSKIIANKPVSVVAGNQCTNIPVGNQWCDYTVEMLIPTSTWGKHYHVAKVPDRKYPPIIRVFSKEGDTKVFRDGRQITYIPFAHGVFEEGWQEMRLTPKEDGLKSVVISGDKPIHVVKYNTGVQEDGYPLPNTDPFVESQTPVEQYETEITFCTPGSYGGQSFKENYLNLVFQTDGNEGIPDDLMFGEYKVGDYLWKQVNTMIYGYEIFDYDVGDKEYGTALLQLPEVGVFKIKAEKPFAAYSFGYDWCDSYGYPTAGAFIDLDQQDDDKAPPEVDYENDDGNYSGEINDESNLAFVEMYDAASYNYEFTHGDFVPGNDKSVWWKLNRVDKNKPAQAALVVTDKAGNKTVKVFNEKGVISDVEDDITFEKADLRIYPEPVSDNSTIRYKINRIGPVDIKIVDISGKEVKTLYQSESQSPGEYELPLNSNVLAEGIYFVRMKLIEDVVSKKFRVVR